MAKLVTSVAAQVDEDHVLSVPVAIDGRAAQLVVATADAWSTLGGAMVDRLGLRRRTPARIRFSDADGKRLEHIVVADTVTVGEAGFKSYLEFLVDEKAGDRGWFAMNFLSDYDFEIDNTQKKLSLYAHETCGRPSAAWARGAVEIPFRMKYEVPVATVSLNGRDVSAMFSTGQVDTHMSLAVATAQFGITPDSPGVTRLGPARYANGSELFQMYRYTFDELYISGIRFENVPVLLLDVDGYDIELGTHELKYLHLYFAFAKSKVYAAVNEAQ